MRLMRPPYPVQRHACTVQFSDRVVQLLTSQEGFCRVLMLASCMHMYPHDTANSYPLSDLDENSCSALRAIFALHEVVKEKSEDAFFK